LPTLIGVRQSCTSSPFWMPDGDDSLSNDTELTVCTITPHANPSPPF
jgi:hypothetical protein